MVFALATAVSEITPVPAGENLETRVILWTFLAAGALFILFWMVRFARDKMRATPPRPDLHAGVPLVPASADESPYLAPQALSPLPPLSESRGITRHFKVPTSHYRLLDLPLIGLIFLIYCGLMAGGGGGGEPVPVEQKFTPEVLTASIFFQLLLMGMVCAFVIRRISQSEWLGLRWKQWWLVFAIAPATVFFIWFVLLLTHVSGWNGWLERTLGIEPMQESVRLLQEAKDPLVIILMGVAAVVVAPFAEEVVFRGYLYPAAKRFCGPLGAMLFSSLVFAAAHGNVVAMLPLFILAMLLCLIYELTGSIWANISVHFLFNAATVALQLMARYGIIEISSPT